MRIPRALHEVLGEDQGPGTIGSVLVLGLGGTAALLAGDPHMPEGLPAWRAGLTIVLVVDVISGAVANFSPGTSAFYATRPRHRTAFLAVHVHLVAIALLLEVAVVPAVVLWFVTVASAAAISRARSPVQQLQGAAAVVVAAGFGAPVLMEGSVTMTAVSMLFVVKVALAFAVDHYGDGSRSTASVKSQRVSERSSGLPT